MPSAAETLPPVWSLHAVPPASMQSDSAMAAALFAAFFSFIFFPPFSDQINPALRRRVSILSTVK